MRLFAIGDIHGCSTALKTLVSELQFQAGDTVITLGDYVDRGPDSCAVLELLIELSTRINLVPLLGNHELMMLHARHNRSMLWSWISHGGDATLKAYNATTWNEIPEHHWHFLEHCLPYHQTATDFFVHANADPNLQLDEQSEHQLFWERLSQPKPHHSGRRMICGHTAQHDGLPLDFGHTLCIDTWAYGHGWLTCLDVLRNRCWQAREDGSFRTFFISPAMFDARQTPARSADAGMPPH